LKRHKSTINERLANAQSALTNARNDPQLAALLAAYGYDAQRLEQGQALRSAALALHDQQKDLYDGLRSARSKLSTFERAVYKRYMHHLKIARTAFEQDPDTRARLELGGRRAEARAGWLAQARKFYRVALATPEIAQRLITFGAIQAELEQAREQIDQVAARQAERSDGKGSAKGATRARTDALAALDEWMRDFIQVARVALKAHPELLDKLGVAARRASRRRGEAPAALAVDGGGSGERAATDGEPVPELVEHTNGRVEAGASA
jgi:hypothetical protein